MIEHKSFAVECKGLDGDGSVELYAAVFGNVDRAGEVIQPGAFKNLGEFVESGWLAVNHDWDKLPVATIDGATQDAKGLLIKAHFHSTPEAQNVRTTIKERLARGKSVKASIGYKVTDDEQVKMDGKSIRSLKAIDIYESSIVNVPCNPAAEIVGAKSFKLIDADEVKDYLIQLKAGRVLSAANLATLRKWRETARQYASLADEMDSLIAQHDPPKLTDPPPIPEALTGGKSLAGEMRLLRDFLATCAKFNV
jgi:hypothetical protein